MADADEDVVPNRANAGMGDNDLSDEMQDFRFLAQLSGKNDASIPKRGDKDFEPHHTTLQSSALEGSRAAMHAALSAARIHRPQNRVTAVYDPSSNGAWVDHAKGLHFRTTGKGVADGRVWLAPEEALFLLERGSLDVRWPDPDDEQALEDEGLPMSLQAAYAAFIGLEEAVGGKLTLDRYTVYASLRRSGYIVMRGHGWDGSAVIDAQRTQTSSSQLSRNSYGNLGLFAEIWRVAFGERADRSAADRSTHGPLVPPGTYRSYADIYRRLALIPYHNPSTSSSLHPPSPTPDDPTPFTVAYHVFKPSPKFRKSEPGTPDFRVCVVSARSTSVPTLSQIHLLLASTPPDPAASDAPLYQKLKKGHRSVVLAIVDEGVPSYIRMADAAFGQEKVYERKQRGPGRKRGGFRGRGGRGRG